MDEYLREVNKQWKDKVGEHENRTEKIIERQKCVRFGGVKIYPMIAWSFAYRAARVGAWEQYSRDQARFSRRIANLEPKLSLN